MQCDNLTNLSIYTKYIQWNNESIIKEKHVTGKMNQIILKKKKTRREVGKSLEQINAIRGGQKWLDRKIIQKRLTSLFTITFFNRSTLPLNRLYDKIFR